MTRYRVSEITRELLDAAVATADQMAFEIRGTGPTAVCIVDGRIFNPSTDLALAMGIAWRDRIAVADGGGGYWFAGKQKMPGIDPGGDIALEGSWSIGPDPLVAICRAKVVSHFGDFVALP